MAAKRRNIILPSPQETLQSEMPPSLRLEIMLRKEREKIEEEANYTYKPKIIGDLRRSLSCDADRFSRLYGDAITRQNQHKQKSSQEVELTFKPVITSMARSRGSSRDRSGKSVGERLYTCAIAKSTTTPEKSKDSEAVFSPTISRRAQSIEPTSKDETCSRLYQYSRVLREKLERLESENEAKSLESCTFTPVIISKTRASSAEPRGDATLPARMKEFEQYRRRKLVEKIHKKDEEEMKEATFKPKLISKSGKRESAMPLLERLVRPKATDRAALEAKVYAENTFRPQIFTKETTRGASPARSASPSRGEVQEEGWGGSIYERLYRSRDQRWMKVERERKELLDRIKEQLPFKPTINPPMRRRGPDGHASDRDGDEDSKDSVSVFTRLSNAEDRTMMNKVLAKLKVEVEMRGCTFQPQLLTKKKSFPMTGAGPIPGEPVSKLPS